MSGGWRTSWDRERSGRPPVLGVVGFDNPARRGKSKDLSEIELLLRIILMGGSGYRPSRFSLVDNCHDIVYRKSWQDVINFGTNRFMILAEPVDSLENVTERDRWKRGVI